MRDLSCKDTKVTEKTANAPSQETRKQDKPDFLVCGAGAGFGCHTDFSLVLATEPRHCVVCFVYSSYFVFHNLRFALYRVTLSV